MVEDIFGFAVSLAAADQILEIADDGRNVSFCFFAQLQALAMA